MKAVEITLIVLGLALFLALCLYQIELPGLHYDEAREAGVPAMQLITGQPVEAFRGAGVRLFGAFLPLMVQDYIGALNVYLALPFLALFGINVFALRLMPIACAALSLLLAYCLARELFGRRVAAITYILLAVNPSFIFWSRQGIFVTFVTVPLSLGALLCFLRWWRSGGAIYLCVGAFLLGLGLYAKLLFIWFIGAAAFSLLILRWGRWRPFRQIGGQIALAFLPFVAGLSPLLLYNLQTGGTFAAVKNNLVSSYYGTSNLAFLPNLLTRLDQFKALVEGGNLEYLGRIFPDRVFPDRFLWPAALVGALAIVLWPGGEREARRKALFPFLVMAFFILESCFTVSALWLTHYALLTPWPPLALGAALDFLARRKLRKTVLAFPMATVALLTVTDLHLDWSYHQALRESGGLGDHSEAIYTLAESLEERGLAGPLALDWGFAAQVEFLTKGRVRPLEIFGYEWATDPTFAARLAPFLTQEDAIYIFRNPEVELFHRREAFEEIVAKAGRAIQVEQVIPNRNGQPIFLITTLPQVSEPGG
ncbi:MAG: ArnT family glycosyltransferase [Anaerolineae bacterium]